MTSAHHRLAALAVDGVEVACYQDASAVTDRRLSPRPFLHPVRTLAGTVVTDCMPEDHRWHLGLSIAVQDVGGVNLWGGRTYVRDRGYVWRDDHGGQRHRGWVVHTPDRVVEDLGWHAPGGRCLLDERRSFHATACDVAGSAAWALAVDFRLRNVSGADLALGSPATNGRVGAGYGGLFWRLPAPAAAPRVFTAAAEGEAAVHGSHDPWLAWVGATADVGATGPSRRPRSFSLVLAGAPGDTSGPDPWFVRVGSYPGVCVALAFEHPALLVAGGTLTRHVDALIADAVLDGAEAAAWAGDRTGLAQ